MKLIFDNITRRCIGTLDGDNFNGDGIAIDESSLPADLDTSDLSMLFLDPDGVTITFDGTGMIELVKTTRKARIKQEAKALIEALDWRVTRARERAEAGISGGESLANVLILRESIRTSSSAAESAVDALTDVASVQSFSWSVV